MGSKLKPTEPPADPTFAAWATKASALLASFSPDSNDAAPEAVYNAYVCALREGRLVEMTTLMARLQDRERELKVKTEAAWTRSGQFEPVLKALEKRRDQGAQEALEWILGLEKGVFLAFDGDPDAPPIGRKEGGVVHITHVPSLDDAIQQVRKVYEHAESEGEEAFVERYRVSFLIGLLTKALRSYELHVWPPLWEERTLELRSPAPLFAPRPLRRQEVEFHDRRAPHRPFSSVITAMYLYQRFRKKLSHADALNVTRQWHDENHGPIIDEEFESSNGEHGREIADGTLREILDLAKVWPNRR